MKKIIYSFLVLTSFNLNAQNIWGTGSPIGVSEGEFDNTITILQSTISNSYDVNNWTALSVYDNGNVTPGNAYWTRTPNGTSQGAYGAVTTNSPTAANGAALFDSDFLDNAGTQGAFGTGTSPSIHRGELISPKIDLTGYINKIIGVKFYCDWRNYQSVINISFSVDDGINWTNLNLDTFLPAASNAQNGGWVEAIFPNITNGVTNLSQCRLRYTFEGEYYYCFIDDVTIFAANAIDLTIAEESTSGTTLASSLYYGCATNNRHFPLSQINSHQFEIGANIKNLGFTNVVPSDNAQLEVIIQENQTGNWIDVHNQTESIANIQASTNGTTGTGTPIAVTLSNISWAAVGEFRTCYIVSQAQDADNSNDTLYQYFTINDNSYASKVDKDNAGLPVYNSNIFPQGGGLFSDIEYGSMFEFNDAVNESLSIDSVIFGYYVPASTYSNVTLAVNIYEFSDGSNGGTSDGRIDANGNELNWVGTNLNTISITTTNTYGTATVSGFVDPYTGNPTSSLVNGYYLITIQNLASYNGVNSFDGTNTLHFATSTSESYSFNMNSTSNVNVVANASPTKIIDGTGNGSWDWLGFGANIVPSFGVCLSGICTPITATQTVTNCGDFTWIDGNTYTTDNNTATYTITNGASNSCDSIVTLNLTIPTIDVTTTDANFIISANNTSATSYQWIDCSNNTPLSGATNSTFTATANGDYAVIITEGNCSDTSACVNIAGVGIDEVTGLLSVAEIYPNPTTGNLIIKTTQKISTIEVLSVTGKTIMTVNSTHQINLSDFENGVYFIKVKFNNLQVITKRIIKI